MDRIRPEAMGAATSLFNLMRNIGGSVGHRDDRRRCSRGYRQEHSSVLGAARRSVLARRADDVPEPAVGLHRPRAPTPATATERAYAALYGMVQKQAAMLSFIDGFKMLAVVFLVLVPFVFLMKKPRTTAGRGWWRGSDSRIVKSPDRQIARIP